MLQQRELDKVIKNAEASSTAWVPQFYETFAYTQPERNYIYRTTSTASSQKQIPLFTNAGKVGSDIFVNRLQNMLCPIDKDFVVFNPKKSVNTEIKNALDGLAVELSRRTNEEKKRTRLDYVVQDTLYDLIAGTGIIQRRNTRNGLTFEKCRLDQVLLGTETNQTVVRKFKMCARNIGVTFPELFGKTMLGNLIITEQNQFDDVELCDVLYFNEITNKWEYYLRYGNETLLTRRYDSNPFYLFHWSRSSDMAFGAGIGTKAVPAIKRLNSYIRNKLQLIPYAFPMFVTKIGTLFSNDIKFQPGGVIQTQGDPRDLIPIKMNNEVNAFQMEIAAEELSIKQTMLDYTLPADPKTMTAAEVYARTNHQTEMIGGNVSQLTGIIENIAWDIAEDIFNRELRGIVSFSFKFLKDNLECDIINQTSEDTQLINRINAYIANVSFDPQAVWQALNRSETLATLSKSYNIPSELRLNADEIDEQTRQAAEAAANLAQQEVDAKMAVDANKENAIAGREMAVKQNAGAI